MTERMTVQDYVDCFVDYLTDCFETNNDVNTTDVKQLESEIEAYCWNSGIDMDFCNEQVECSDKKRLEIVYDLQFYEWDHLEFKPENLAQVAFCAIYDVIWEDVNTVFLRCAEKILNEKKED